MPIFHEFSHQFSHCRSDITTNFATGEVDPAAATILRRATQPRRPRLGSLSRWWWLWWWWWWLWQYLKNATPVKSAKLRGRQRGKNEEIQPRSKIIVAKTFRNRPTRIEPLRVVSLILSLTTRPQPLQSLRTKCSTWRFEYRYILEAILLYVLFLV